MGQRRSPREKIVLPVRIFGTDQQSRPFDCMAHTLDISSTGVRLGGISPEFFAEGQIVWVKFKARQQKFEVRWVGPPNDPGAKQVGLRAVDPVANIWGISEGSGQYEDQFKLKDGLAAEPVVGNVPGQPPAEQAKKVGSPSEVMRRSKRIQAKVPVRVLSSDPNASCDCEGETFVVNLHGAALRLPQPLPAKTAITIIVGAGATRVEAHVVTCERLGVSAFWMVAVELETPCNPWGLASPPSEWASAEDGESAPPATAVAAASDSGNHNIGEAVRPPEVPASAVELAAPPSTVNDVSRQVDDGKHPEPQNTRQLLEQIRSRLSEQISSALDEREQKLLAALDQKRELQAQNATRNGMAELSANVSRQMEQFMAEMRQTLQQVSATAQEQLADMVSECEQRVARKSEEAMLSLSEHADEIAQQQTELLELRAKDIGQQQESLRQSTAGLDGFVTSLRDRLDRLEQRGDELRTQLTAIGGDSSSQRVNEVMDSATGSDLAAQYQQQFEGFQEQLRSVADRLTADFEKRCAGLLEQSSQNIQAVFEKNHQELQAATTAAWSKIEADVTQALQRRAESASKEEEKTDPALAEAERLSRSPELLEQRRLRVEAELEEVAATVASRTAAKLEELEEARFRVAQKLELDLAKSLGALLSRAEAASNDLALLLGRIKPEIERGRQDLSEKESELAKTQEWVQSELQRFRSAVRDTLQEGSELIKRRLESELFLAEQPLVARSQKRNAEIEQLITSRTQELAKQVETASQQLQECHRAIEASIKESSQSLLQEGLESFRKDVQNLSERSLARWNLALTDAFKVLPQLLGHNIKRSLRNE